MLHWEERIRLHNIQKEIILQPQASWVISLKASTHIPVAACKIYTPYQGNGQCSHFLNINVKPELLLVNSVVDIHCADILLNERLDPTLVIRRANPSKPMALKSTNINLICPDDSGVSLRKLESPLKV